MQLREAHLEVARLHAVLRQMQADASAATALRRRVTARAWSRRGPARFR
jgi:hypothetical protein